MKNKISKIFLNSKNKTLLIHSIWTFIMFILFIIFNYLQYSEISKFFYITTVLNIGIIIGICFYMKKYPIK